MQSILKNRSSDFLHWWLAGLALWLPESMRERIRQIPDRLLIRPEENGFRLDFHPGDSRNTPDSYRYTKDDTHNVTALSDWLATHNNETTETILRLPPEAALHKQLTLPAAGREDLYAVLGFEMDKHTPFSVDQVYYDCSITGKAGDGNKLQVDLHVLPKQNAAPLLAELEEAGITPQIMDTGGNRHGNPPINFLPPDRRHTRRNRLDAATLRLLVVAVLLLSAALYLPLLQQQHALAGLELEVDRVQQLAREVQPLISEKERLTAKSRFIAAKQENRIPVIRVLDELTRILPDDTWINRLVLQDDELQLHGESDPDTPVIQLLESAELFRNARFRSPVTYNSATGKNRFHVSAALSRRQDS